MNPSKLVFVLFIFMVSSQELLAQRLAPVVGLDYSMIRFKSTLTPYNQFNAHIGAVYLDRYFLLVHFGAYTTLNEPNAPRNFHFYANSFSGKARLLSTNYAISPMIQVNAGFGYRYTGDTTYLGSNYNIVSSNAGNIQGTYDRMTSFGSIQLLADIRWNRFQFQLGGGPYFSNIVMRRIQDPTQTKPIHNNTLVASVSASYSLKIRSRQKEESK